MTEESIRWRIAQIELARGDDEVVRVTGAEPEDFAQGENDGRKDGAAGVKPLAHSLMKRHYSSSYQAGYAQGYEKATEPRRLRAEGKV